MLTKESRAGRTQRQTDGDSTASNTCRLILDAVGHETLADIVSDPVDLLGTCAAVHEKNGDYAFGPTTSNWCRLLNTASRRLCSTRDSQVALSSGKWHCHECRWADASRRSMETDEAVDVECAGGLRLFAIPIRAAGEIVGSVNFGYGDPPRDARRLEQIASSFAVSVAELRELAESHERRPPFMVELVKDRLFASARLIGEIVARTQSQQRASAQARLLDMTRDAIVVVDMEDRVEFWNRGAERIYGWTAEEAVGRTLTELVCDPSQQSDMSQDLVWEEEEEEWSGELQQLDKHGKQIIVSSRRDLVWDGQRNAKSVLVINSDITRRRQLETQLTQAQKMEAIGRLTGGVAHDFNNLLTAILGYSDLALASLDADSPVRQDVAEIKKAGERAAALTQQLLAFSRRQVLQPRVFNLNETVQAVQVMLQRLIGEDIQLRTNNGATLWLVRADPNQMEQVLVNLAVNARDAMPDGGTLTVETANTELDDEFARGHVGSRPGSYVMLSVTDNGQGMTRDVLDRVFEPFFTTKGKGKGTGLGLSTVYGIVKQSGGYISVESAPACGTTFRVYLPRVEQPAEAVPAEMVRAAVLTGSETILLVEDDDTIRELARKMLEQMNYRVLPARDGNDALLLVERHNRGIDLVLTDIVMPNMSGPQLVKRLIALRPGIRVLYMSGYSDRSPRNLTVPATCALIHKPFDRDVLALKVRQVLDGTTRWQTTDDADATPTNRSSMAGSQTATTPPAVLDVMA